MPTHAPFEKSNRLQSAYTLAVNILKQLSALSASSPHKSDFNPVHIRRDHHRRHRRLRLCLPQHPTLTSTSLCLNQSTTAHGPAPSSTLLLKGNGTTTSFPRQQLQWQSPLLLLYPIQSSPPEPKLSSHSQFLLNTSPLSSCSQLPHRSGVPSLCVMVLKPGTMSSVLNKTS